MVTVTLTSRWETTWHRAVFFSTMAQVLLSLVRTFGEISSVRSLAVADIDRDGDLDLLSTCRGRQNRIYLNSGDGHFATGKPFGNERDSTIDVAVADWNGDGHLDLVLANRDDQQNAILINDGHMNFATVIPFGTQNEQTRAVAVADLNGDAQPDIIAANIGQTNRVYLADGKGGFAATIEFRAGRWQHVRARSR